MTEPQHTFQKYGQWYAQAITPERRLVTGIGATPQEAIEHWQQEMRRAEARAKQEGRA